MRVRVGDVHLYFDVEGAGLVVDGAQMRERPTLLLLHGGPGFDHSSFKPLFSELVDVAQIVYLDHRGNGRSEPGERRDWTLAQWGDDVRAFCEALGIERPIVLGQSFGGMVAMAYATRHPDHPGKLVLSSTTARMRLERILRVFERLGGESAREAARAYWTNPGEKTLPDYARICIPLYNQTPQDPDGQKRTLWNLDVLFHFSGGEGPRFDLTGDLGRIRCPTLVLAGEEDPITPVEDALDIAAALPPESVRLDRFAGCGHGVFRDQPAPALTRLREFISS